MMAADVESRPTGSHERRDTEVTVDQISGHIRLFLLVFLIIIYMITNATILFISQE